eukprot:4516131-Pleurochrysis_carterae.AAC.1
MGIATASAVLFAAGVADTAVLTGGGGGGDVDGVRGGGVVSAPGDVVGGGQVDRVVVRQRPGESDHVREALQLRDLRTDMRMGERIQPYLTNIRAACTYIGAVPG